MSKFIPIFFFSPIIFCGISLIELGIIATIIESSFSGKFGGITLGLAGGILLIGAIAILNSELRLEELYEERRKEEWAT